MTFADFYLICFIAGCALSVLSFLCGAFHLHLPGGLHHFVHCGGVHDFSHHGGSDSQASRFNLPTIMVFLAWFGGAGYLVTSLSGLGFIIVLGIACFSGLIGGS